MPSPEAVIEMQKERVKALSIELENITKDNDDADIVLDAMVEGHIIKKTFDIYLGLYEAYQTIATYSYFLGDEEQGDYYSDLMDITAASWEELRKLDSEE